MDVRRDTTTPVTAGGVTIGGGTPVSIQAMTDTDTADATATGRQIRRLAEAGAELVRLTVDRAEAAAAVPEIRRRVEDSGCSVPLVADLHFNGLVLLQDHPACLQALDKIRINPADAGPGRRRDADFETICALARDHGLAVRIGVNGGSLDPKALASMMQDNHDHSGRLSAQEVVEACAVESVLRSLDLALSSGLGEDRLVVSCKVSSPPSLIRINRRLAREIRQPLHLGLTEAGAGRRGAVRSIAALAPLLATGIGDTVRMSLTPAVDGDRTDEVTLARELLQALGLRSFSPTVIACPGCGRTTASAHRRIVERVEAHIASRMADWNHAGPGVRDLTVSVMGCLVNGPGESRTADIAISMPGAGDSPSCPVYVDGNRTTTLHGDPDEVADRFIELVDAYVERRFGGRRPSSRDT